MKRIIGAILCGGVAVFAGATATDDDTTRDDRGEIVESGGLGVFRIEVGDCLQLPNEDQYGQEYEVASVEGVPCDTPHDAQLYAEFDVAGDTFPGGSKLDGDAVAGCEARWADALHTAWEDDRTYDFTVFRPTELSWRFDEDREVQCFVVRIDGDPITVDLLRP